MGCGYVLAADRVELIVPDAVHAAPAHGFKDTARPFDPLPRYRLSLLGDADLSREDCL